MFIVYGSVHFPSSARSEMCRMSLLTELKYKTAPRASNMSLLTELQSILTEPRISRFYQTTDFPNTL